MNAPNETVLHTHQLKGNIMNKQITLAEIIRKEGNFHIWTHRGHYCAIGREPNRGFWCGYVAAPQGFAVAKHIGVDPDKADGYFDVHGGITFADDNTPPILTMALDAQFSTLRTNPAAYSAVALPTNVIWYGFDCAHAFDYIPFVDHPSQQLAYAEPRPVYRDMEYVMGECISLAEQMMDFKPYEKAEPMSAEEVSQRLRQVLPPASLMPDPVFVVEEERIAQLRRIRDRLYDEGRPFAPDERRVLAKQLDGIIASAVAIPYAAIKP